MAYSVLVVDDEAPVRDLFYDIFKKEGYEVKCVANAEESVELINKTDYDVVLMDIKFPGMSGLEALKRIKDAKPSTVVIMITGFGYDEDLIAKSKEYGCAGYIVKNMPISQMISSFKLFVRSAKEKK